MKYQRRSYHPSTAGDLLLLSKHSAGPGYSETTVLLNRFFLQAREGDTPGGGGWGWVREGVRARKGTAEREETEGTSLCGCVPCPLQPGRHTQKKKKNVEDAKTRRLREGARQVG